MCLAEDCRDRLMNPSLGARLRAYHEELAAEHDRYHALTREQREQACQSLQARYGARPFHIREILREVP